MISWFPITNCHRYAQTVSPHCGTWLLIRNYIFSVLSEHRSLSLSTAIAIVIASMIGTGVFTSLGFQLVTIQSEFVIMLLWIFGGVIAISGALCYAELCTMMPRSGGEYHLLRETWHPAMGFLAGWISITVGFSAPVAIAAKALGHYAGESLGITHPDWISVSVVVLVTTIHLGHLRYTSGFQILFTSFKIALILILIVVTFVLTRSSTLSLTPHPGDFQTLLGADFAVSLLYVTYSYTGWNAAAYIAGEIRNPQRNLPLAMLIGTAVVTVLYVCLNLAFLKAAPMDALEGKEDVGRIAASYLFGTRGGNLMGLLIAFGLFSSISSMTWAGPRVAAVMGEDYSNLRLLARRNRYHIPWIALLLQAIIVIALCLTVDLDQLMRYIQAILTLSSLLVVIGVFHLRRTRPDATRPIRVPLYPFPLILFAGMSVYILFYYLITNTTESLMGFFTLALGYVVYRFSRKS